MHWFSNFQFSGYKASLTQRHVNWTCITDLQSCSLLEILICYISTALYQHLQRWRGVIPRGEVCGRLQLFACLSMNVRSSLHKELYHLGIVYCRGHVQGGAAVFVGLIDRCSWGRRRGFYFGTFCHLFLKDIKLLSKIFWTFLWHFQQLFQTTVYIKEILRLTLSSFWVGL